MRKDFQAGGGYYVRSGERVLFEVFTRPGDALVDKGRILHGVATVTLYRTR